MAISLTGVAILLLALLYGAAAATQPGYSCDCSSRNNCMCPSNEAPGGMELKDVPQFILWTHDDGITPLTERSFREVADERQNPNGCPVRTTMFTTAQATDCELAYGMWKDGYEIATHTADHTSLPDGTPLNETVDAILGAKRFLSQECGIPASDIRGFRNPYLVTNPLVRQVLFENGFLYDSTLLEATNSESLSTSMEDRTWPYTMDYGIAQNCAWFADTQACDKSERWPGLWEVPLWVLQVLGLEFTMDPGYYGGRGVYEPLKEAFDAAYAGNRAPVPIYIHTTWVEKQPERLEELKRFADYTLDKGDVFWVTMSQLIEWMRNPVPASQLSKAMCARPAAAAAPPAMPADGANVTLTLNGATATQVADQSDRLVAAVAQLLGAESDDTFVAATSGGPGASKAAGAQRRLLAQAGSPLQVTVVAAGADPLALYWHASAANTQAALDGELSVMGLQTEGKPVVVPFKGGVALSVASAPAPAPVPVPKPAAVPLPRAAPAATPAAASGTAAAAGGADDATTSTPTAASDLPPSSSSSSTPAAPTASSTPAPATMEAVDTSGSGGLSTGVIVGIAVGAVAMALLLAAIAAFLLTSRPRRSHSAKMSAASSIVDETPQGSPTKGSPIKGSPIKGSPTKQDTPRQLNIIVTSA